MMYFSKAGKVTLIKSTLSSLPTCFMSLFSFLARVANRIEKLQQDFLWDEIVKEFKCHLVSWSKVFSPISKGDLGVQNLRIFNCALLGKWLCMEEAWWRIVVDSTFDSSWGGWCSIDPPGHMG
jgi:hypothetical protein